jgi:hypothetical protein
MHQQIRLTLGNRSQSDGVGAMAAAPLLMDPIEVRMSLLSLLDKLAGKGFDLKMVAGSNIESTGELIFAVDDSETTACYEYVTRTLKFTADLVEPLHGHAEKRPGGLAAAIRKMNLRRPIHEIFIGEEVDGEIPFQVTTFAPAAEDDTNT